MLLEGLFDHEMGYPPVRAEDRVGDGGPDGVEGSGQVEDVGQAVEVVERAFPGGGGVYLLTDAQDRLVQLAAAGDLRRALRNRLLEPQDDEAQAGTARARRKPRLGEIVRKIRWRPAHSMFEIDYEYYRIARELMPEDYLENVAFGPSWFVYADAWAEIPRFVASKRVGYGSGVDLGPLATQADAGRFMQILEDAFDLCRHRHILEQAPNGQACAYFEMNKCSAPCDGSIPMSQYRETVVSALAFARGGRAEIYARWRRRMQEAADGLEYEKAAMIKQRLERAEGIEHAAFKLVRPIEEFNYLVVQRGRGRTRVKPFFVRGGWITPGEAVRLRDVEEAVPPWCDRMSQPAALPEVSESMQQGDNRFLSEQIWLVSHYLFKRDARGLFIHASELGDPAELTERVRERFERRARESTDDETGEPAGE